MRQAIGIIFGTACSCSTTTGHHGASVAQAQCTHQTFLRQQVQTVQAFSGPHLVRVPIYPGMLTDSLGGGTMQASDGERLRSEEPGLSRFPWICFRPAGSTPPQDPYTSRSSGVELSSFFLPTSPMQLATPVEPNQTLEWITELALAAHHLRRFPNPELQHNGTTSGSIV